MSQKTQTSGVEAKMMDCGGGANYYCYFEDINSDTGILRKNTHFQKGGENEEKTEIDLKVNFPFLKPLMDLKKHNHQQKHEPTDSGA